VKFNIITALNYNYATNYIDINMDINEKNLGIMLTDDYLIIQNLQTNGLSFLRKCYNCVNENFSDLKEIIDLYHKMFLDDSELFENSFSEYISYINSTDGKLWNILVETLEEDEIKNYLTELILEVTYLPFNEKLEIYKKLFNTNKVINVLKNDELWFYNDGFAMCNKSFIGDLINSLSVDNEEDWKDGICALHNFIFPFVKNYGFKTIFIKWFSQVINLNIIKKNLNDYSDDTLYKLSTDKFLFNIVGILYIFFIKGAMRSKKTINIKRLRNLKYEYITSSNCSINWYNKNSKKIYNTDFFTKCFFLMLNAMRVCYIPQFGRIKQWKHFKSHLEIVADHLITNGTMMAQTELLDVYKLISNISGTISSVNTMLKNKIMRQWIDKVYDIISIWITQIKPAEFKIDDILQDMTTYILNYHKFLSSHDTINNVYELNELQTNMFIEIIKSKNYTSNPEIRFNSIKIIEKYSNKLCHIQQSSIIEALIEFHNDLEDYEMPEINAIVKRVRMYKMIIESLEFNNETIDNSLGSNRIRAKVFINIMLNGTNYINDIIGSLEDLLDTTQISNTSHQYIKQARTLYSFQDLHSDFILYITEFLRFESFLGELKSNELLMTVCTLITYTTNRIVNKYNYKFPYLELEKNDIHEKINMIDIINNIVKICITLRNHVPDFASKLISSSILFNLEDFKKILTRIAENNESSIELFSCFVDECTTIVEKMSEENNIEYPDEFLDPITYSPITEPIKLPNMGSDDRFHDKSVIIKHILNKKENPYTREPLTITELEKYNDIPEIKLNNEVFKKRMKSWKEKNNL
jgi:hypothetical protein